MSDVKVWADIPHPGLLTEWRKRPDGSWEGFVIFVETYSGGWQVKQKWVDAAQIKPREDEPPTPQPPAR